MLKVNQTLEGKSTREIINNALPYIFDFDFPIWDEGYRSQLEYRIVSHYYLEEIGFETFAMFKLYLDNWLNEHMPYYNVLYDAGKQLGDIFTINSHTVDHLNTDNLHTTGAVENENVNNTVDDTINQNGTEKTDRTGTNKGESSENTSNTSTNSKIGNNWNSARNVAVGEEYKSNEYVSDSRLDEIDETVTDVRSGNKSGMQSTNETENVSEVNSNTRVQSRKNDTQRGRNRSETYTEKDDELRSISKSQDVADRMEQYKKLSEYYRDIDCEVINGLSVLFMQLY